MDDKKTNEVMCERTVTVRPVENGYMATISRTGPFSYRKYPEFYGKTFAEAFDNAMATFRLPTIDFTKKVPANC